MSDINFSLQPITTELISELNTAQKQEVLMKYHKWLKKERKNDKRELVNLNNKIQIFKGKRYRGIKMWQHSFSDKSYIYTLETYLRKNGKLANYFTGRDIPASSVGMTNKNGDKHSKS